MFTNDLIILIIVTVLLLGVLYNAIMGKEMSATSASEDTLQQLLSEVKAIKEIVQTLILPAAKHPPPTPQLHNSPEPAEEASQEASKEAPESFPRTRLKSPTPKPEEFFSSPYNALAFGFFQTLKMHEFDEADHVPVDDDEIGEAYNYRIIQHGGNVACTIYQDALQRALTLYLFRMTNTRGAPFTKNVLDAITSIMTRSGWKSCFDAKYARRTKLTLDYEYEVWLHEIVTMDF